MPITQDVLEATLQQAFPDAAITCQDLAGDDDHWAVTVVSPVFTGKTRIAQHQMVQQAVKDHAIHALSITTRMEA